MTSVGSNKKIEKANKAGFKAVEFLFPYPFSASEIKQKLDQYQLKLVLHNLPAGDWDHCMSFYKSIRYAG